ncbi:MAG: PLP-dependent aspartate aminotransferase family protein [Castellaniella sp.]|uniref:trans-sulfuration enzyme family protein n=1 Tax=Castellaniella sp. TaxID=1955812 RepID=UPI002A36EF83|nr:PLP-dependent aspartate aminotransferase family protein [Castellaniella sp.]MDY0308310.1 PLP-dependent aspartate aminotransferase family protein [Castellaniella sp.]
MNSHDSDRIDTVLQHIGQAPLDPATGSGPVALPSYRTSTVRFASMDVLDRAQAAKQRGERVPTYGRVGLQTHEALETLLCQLEGGERAFLAPSGMAAISMALMALLGQGDHALVVDSVYGPVRYFHKTVLSRMGVAMDFVHGDLASLQAALRPQTRVLYLESPGSLLMEMLDLPALTRWAHEHGLTVVADNTWGSGYLYRPLALGADVSVIAATKYVGGHSDLMLGAAVARDPALIGRLHETHYALGSTVSADDAWLALRGARTLGVRLRACAEHALEVCRWLAAQPQVSRIFFPAWPDDAGHALWRRDATGSNGLLSVAVDFDTTQVRRLIDGLRLFGIGYSWGGYESLVTQVEPAALAAHGYWTSLADERMKAGTVLRLHIGLEDPADLIADLAQAFEVAGRA